MRSRERLLQRSRVHSSVRFRKCATVFLACGVAHTHSSRTFTLYNSIVTAHWFAHIYVCAAVLLFLRSSRSSALFVGVRFDVHKEKAVASCACAQNFAFATATQLRTCKYRRRRLHKTIRSQTHMNVHANVDARSVAFSRA